MALSGVLSLWERVDMNFVSNCGFGFVSITLGMCKEVHRIPNIPKILCVQAEARNELKEPRKR